MDFFIIKGVLTGLMLGLMVGPIVITMVETAVLKGRKTALIYAWGVWLSDAAYIYLTHIGLSVFLTQPKVKMVLGLAGGVLLLGLGAYNFFCKNRFNPFGRN